METKAMALVRGERMANKSVKGGRSYARIRGLMHYIAYGRYEEHPLFGLASNVRSGSRQEVKLRGNWLDHNGRPVSHEAVRRWAKDKVHRYGYDFSYQLLLSTRHGGLSERDFNRVLREGSQVSQVMEWKYMVHEDTDNQHAHVILLRREKLPNALYKAWQQTMQAELERLQVERYQEQQLQQERQVEQEQASHLTPATETPDGDEKARRQEWEISL
jgi:hypothetical protein